MANIASATEATIASAAEDTVARDSPRRLRLERETAGKKSVTSEEDYAAEGPLLKSIDSEKRRINDHIKRLNQVGQSEFTKKRQAAKKPREKDRTVVKAQNALRWKAWKAAYELPITSLG